MEKIKVTVWNEYVHELQEEDIRALYPQGLHGQIKAFLDPHEELEVRTATLHGPDFLTDELLNDTDVLIWWGHVAHWDVTDELAFKVRDRIYNDGMGFIALHSAHMSKPFRYTVGSSGRLLWSDNQKEIIWNINPAHPIAAGLPERIDLGEEEMYGEPFSIPQPDEQVFLSWFEHGYVFRSGCCWYRGRGKVFYFQPGHESCRSFYHPLIQKIIYQAVLWAKPGDFGCPMHHCDYRKNVFENGDYTNE